MKDYLNQEKLNLMKNGKGFIAALDQSGGSSAKTLLKYGVDSSMYQNDEEMFELIHDMRKRVFTSPVFTNEKIIGSILFYKTMESKVEDKYTSEYLWENKKILSFLKVDKGLMEEEKQVKLMKDIPDLEEQLSIARTRDVFGTKMRSVILGANREGIRKVVNQQFEFAKIICENGLVPIIEPEVDIHIEDKEEAEKILKEEIKTQLDNWDSNMYIMFKFTIPTIDNFYEDLYDYSCVVRIVALSGGYEIDDACEKLSHNHRMIASFSRALLESLRYQQSDEEFNKELEIAIDKIYQASI